MSHFLDDAAGLFDAAQSVSETGNVPSDLTVLVGFAGDIRMIAGSDWPLESLAAHHGASTVYRVNRHRGTVTVEGRCGACTCRLSGETPAATARRLLG